MQIKKTNTVSKSEIMIGVSGKLRRRILVPVGKSFKNSVKEGVAKWQERVQRRPERYKTQKI